MVGRGLPSEGDAERTRSKTLARFSGAAFAFRDLLKRLRSALAVDADVASF